MHSSWIDPCGNIRIEAAADSELHVVRAAAKYTGNMNMIEPQPAPRFPPLVDPFQRTISYLRVSVTDRCDFRCVYCMAEHMEFLPKRELLTLEELDRLCTAFVSLGVRKLRLTGGEPLVRRNVMWLIERLARHLGHGLDEITLTTNGSQLPRFARQLADIGVRRVNVSLDTLDRERFWKIARRDQMNQVLAGLDAAVDAGLQVKINCVALKQVNQEELSRFVGWCGERGFDLTFIEVMPMGDLGELDRVDQYLSLQEVRQILERDWRLEDIPYRTGGPARYTECRETGRKVGFITPLTHNFCESCNRVRLTCTGILYMCLGQEDAADLRTPLRESETEEPLIQAIREAIARKPKGHDFKYERRGQEPAVPRHMSVTGG